MSFEKGATGIGDTVSAQYGQRFIGNEEGTYRTGGAAREASLNFDGDTLDTPVPIPAGAIVYDIVEVGITGTVTTANVIAYDQDNGADTDISGADGAKANEVVVTDAGYLEVTGVTSGSVIVKYYQVA